MCFPLLYHGLVDVADQRCDSTRGSRHAKLPVQTPAVRAESPPQTVDMAYSSLANWDGSQASSPQRPPHPRPHSLGPQPGPIQRLDQSNSKNVPSPRVLSVQASRTSDRAHSAGPSSMVDTPQQPSLPDPPISEEEQTVGKMLLEGLSREPASGTVSAGVRDAAFPLLSAWLMSMYTLPSFP